MLDEKWRNTRPAVQAAACRCLVRRDLVCAPRRRWAPSSSKSRIRLYRRALCRKTLCSPTSRARSGGARAWGCLIKPPTPQTTAFCMSANHTAVSLQHAVPSRRHARLIAPNRPRCPDRPTPNHAKHRLPAPSAPRSSRREAPHAPSRAGAAPSRREAPHAPFRADRRHLRSMSTFWHV